MVGRQVPQPVVMTDEDGDYIGGGGATSMTVQGAAAHDAAASGNPVMVGAKYEATLDLVDDGDASNLKTDPRGNLRVAACYLVSAGADGLANSLTGVPLNTTAATGVYPFAANLNFNGTSWDRQRGNTTGAIVIPPTGWSYAAASGGIVNTTTAVTIKAAAGASVRNYLTGLDISHDALGAATELAIRDGAGGTVLYRVKLQTTATEGRPIRFATPIYSTANTLLEVVTLTAVTGGVFVNASGYTAP
jgi:hypothetical protein